MSFTSFSPVKAARSFMAPTNTAKPAGGPRHPSRSGHSHRQAAAIVPTAGFETVGGAMTTDYVTIDNSMAAGAALAKVRVLAHVIERVYTIYVTGPNDRLDGVLSLRDLLIADPLTPVSSVMAVPRVCITEATTQERAKQIMERQNIAEIPVIDVTASLIGIVTAESLSR